jgi:hypothetical protein
MASQIKLNGQVIKAPSAFSIERYNITKSNRLASGTMVMDLIAKKRKFLLQYTVLGGEDLSLLLSIIDTSAMFFSIEYFEADSMCTKTVYCGPIKYTRFRTDAGWYWKDVSFDLIEQ